MSLWSAFFPLVMTSVPGISPDFASIHIRQAAADFFERSKSYIVELTPQTTTAGVSDYTYQLPENTDMVKVLEAWINGQEAGTELQYRNREARTGIYGLSPLRYRAYPTPSGTGTIAITAAVKPGALSTGIPDEYFSQHYEAISWGAIARLLAVPKKPWTDIATASVYANQFTNASAETQSKTLKSYGRARMRTKADYF